MLPLLIFVTQVCACSTPEACALGSAEDACSVFVLHIWTLCRRIS